MGNTWYRCSYCFRVFQYQRQLIIHKQEVHRESQKKRHRNYGHGHRNNKMMKIEQGSQICQAAIAELINHESQPSSASPSTLDNNKMDGQKEGQCCSVEEMNVDQSMGAQISEMLTKIFEQKAQNPSTSQEPVPAETMQPPPPSTSDLVDKVVLQTPSVQCETMNLRTSSSSSSSTTTTTKTVIAPIIITVQSGVSVEVLEVQPCIHVSVIKANPNYKPNPTTDNNSSSTDRKPDISKLNTTPFTRGESGSRIIELIVLDDDDDKEVNPPPIQAQQSNPPSAPVNNNHNPTVASVTEEATAKKPPIECITIDDDDDDTGEEQPKLTLVALTQVSPLQTEPEIVPRQLAILGSTPTEETGAQHPASSVSEAVVVADQVNLSIRDPPPPYPSEATASGQSAVLNNSNVVGTQTECPSQNNNTNSSLKVSTEVPPPLLPTTTNTEIQTVPPVALNMSPKTKEISTQVSPCKCLMTPIQSRSLPLMLSSSAAAPGPSAVEYDTKQEKLPKMEGYVLNPKKEGGRSFRNNLFGQPTPKGEFKCRDCSKTFSSQWVLDEHIQLHKNLSQLKCTDCDKIFQYPSLLQNHIRTRHTHETPFECSECTEKFKLRQSLKSHLFNKHTKPLVFSTASSDTSN